MVTLGLYSHLLFALMPVVQGAYAWLRAASVSGRWLRPLGLPVRSWLIAVGVALALFSPWLLVMIWGFGDAVAHT